MRGLAEYVMRGRSQALLVAVVTAGIPMFFWVSVAVTALVTLRRGVRDGAMILGAALVPAIVVAWYGEIMPVFALLGVTLLAWLLRLSASWPWTLCAAALMGLVLSGGLYTVGSEYLTAIEQLFRQVFEGMQTQQGSTEAATLVAPSAVDIAGMFGLIHSITLIVCLMLARWWQAALYNPGGFGVEFRAVRLAPAQILGAVAMAALLLGAGAQYWLWARIALLPLLFGGVALTHALLGGRELGRWLWLFYVALLILPPVKQLVVVLAAADGWLDLRRRWLKPPGG